MSDVNPNPNHSFKYQEIIEQSDAKDVHELVQDIDGGESGTEDRLSEEMTSALVMTLAQTGLNDVDDIKGVALGIFHDMEQRKVDRLGYPSKVNGVLRMNDTASTNDIDGQLSKEFAQEYLGLDPSKGEIREFMAQSASETVGAINFFSQVRAEDGTIMPGGIVTPGELALQKPQYEQSVASMHVLDLLAKKGLSAEEAFNILTQLTELTPDELSLQASQSEQSEESEQSVSMHVLELLVERRLSPKVVLHHLTQLIGDPDQ